jgi:hypothetical protein
MSCHLSLSSIELTEGARCHADDRSCPVTYYTALLHDPSSNAPDHLLLRINLLASCVQVMGFFLSCYGTRGRQAANIQFSLAFEVLVLAGAKLA